MVPPRTVHGPSHKNARTRISAAVWHDGLLVREGESGLNTSGSHAQFTCRAPCRAVRKSSVARLVSGFQSCSNHDPGKKFRILGGSCAVSMLIVLLQRGSLCDRLDDTPVWYCQRKIAASLKSSSRCPTGTLVRREREHLPALRPFCVRAHNLLLDVSLERMPLIQKEHDYQPQQASDDKHKSEPINPCAEFKMTCLAAILLCSRGSAWPHRWYYQSIP